MMNEYFRKLKERTIEFCQDRNSNIFLDQLLPLTLYFVVSIWISWPLLKSFSSKIIGDGGDTLHNLWVLGHVREWILGNTSLFYTHQLYYPQGISMLVHGVGPVMGILALPFWFLSSEAAYNGAALVGLVLTGYCAYLLARNQNLTWFSSFYVGLVFLLAPIHVAGLLGHIEKTFLGLLPLTLIALFKSLDVNKNLYWVPVTSLLVMLSLLHSGYQFIYTLISIGFFTAVSLLNHGNRGDKKFNLRIVLLAVNILFFITPFIIAILHAAEDILVDVHLQSFDYIPDVAQLFIPSIYHGILGSGSKTALSSISPETLVNLETNISLFISSLFLCIMAVWKTGKESRWWGLFTLTCVIFALGPSLKLFGMTEFTSYRLPVLMPYAFLTEIPGMDFMRVPGRFMLVAYIGFAITAGYGIDWLIRKETKKHQYIFAVVFTLLLLFEGWSNQWPISDLPEIPDFYKELSKDESDYGVLDIPVKNPGESYYYMIYQMTHRKGISNGYLSRYPQYHPFLLDLMTPNLPPDLHINNRMIKAQDLELLLAHNNYRYAVFHTNLLGENLAQEFSMWISQEKRPVYQDDYTTVFDIQSENLDLPDQSKVAAFHGIGWYDYDWSWGGRWAQSPAEIKVYSYKKETASIEINTMAIFDPEIPTGVGNSGTLSIMLNDTLIQNLPVTIGRTASTQITFEQGWNHIWLSNVSGNFRPRDWQPGNNDNRSISFALADFTITTK